MIFRPYKLLFHIQSLKLDCLNRSKMHLDAKMGKSATNKFWSAMLLHT